MAVKTVNEPPKIICLDKFIIAVVLIFDAIRSKKKYASGTAYKNLIFENNIYYCPKY